MILATPWPPAGPIALIMSSLVYIDLCGVGSHGGIGRRADNESRFREILERITRYIAGYVDLPIFNRNYMLSDLFQTQQNQDSILIMTANTVNNQQTNGLSTLKEIDRDGVELRLVNSNCSNQQPTSNPSINNDSANENDLLSLSSESESLHDANNSVITESTDQQVLSAGGLENLENLAISSSNSIISDVRRLSNGRLNNDLSNQTINILESATTNDNRRESQRTTRVIKFEILSIVI